MSLLLAHASESGFQTVTDERVIVHGAATGRATTKFLPIPHLGAAVIGNGFKMLPFRLVVEGWHTHGDAGDLAKRAPDVLRKAWDEIVTANTPEQLTQMEHRYDDEPAVPIGGFGAVHLMGYEVSVFDISPQWWVFEPPEFATKKAKIPRAPKAARLTNGCPSWWPSGQVAEKFDTLEEMVELGVRIKLERDDPDVSMALDGHVDNGIGGGLWASTIRLGPVGPVITTQRVVDFGDDVEWKGRHGGAWRTLREGEGLTCDALALEAT